MPVWPDLGVAVAELRAFLNDGPVDRPVKSKQVVGQVDGSNTIFMTWEDRVLPGTLIPSINFVDVAASGYTELDPLMGRFQLATAPQLGSTVRAHYYFQYFIDEDLAEAMRMACGEVLQTEDPTGIPIGLKQTTLSFGGYFAFQKQAIRWATRMSS